MLAPNVIDRRFGGLDIESPLPRVGVNSTARDDLDADFQAGPPDAYTYDAALGLTQYEECHPYGTVAYRAMDGEVDVSARRYRYTGMEQDEETGLGYHTARYYAGWLGRWTSADPIGLGGGVNRFGYCGGDPVGKSDPSGLEEFRAGSIITQQQFDRLISGDDTTETGTMAVRLPGGGGRHLVVPNSALQLDPKAQSGDSQHVVVNWNRSQEGRSWGMRFESATSKAQALASAEQAAQRDAQAAAGIAALEKPIAKLALFTAVLTAGLIAAPVVLPLFGESLVGVVAGNAALGGVEGALYGGGDAAIEGGDWQEIRGRALQGAAWGGVTQGALGGVLHVAPSWLGALRWRGAAKGAAEMPGGTASAAKVTPRSAGAAESPMSIAQRGGRHSGFLKQASTWTRHQLTRASRSFQREIDLHDAKIANPADFVRNWNTMGAREQQGLLRHWEKEIANFADQQSIVEALLRSMR